MTIALRADSRAAEEKSMDQTELERAIEAILFAAGEAVPAARLALATEQPLDEVEQAAKRLIDSCKKCICAVEEFGPLNEANRELAEYARRIGKTGKNI